MTQAWPFIKCFVKVTLNFTFCDKRLIWSTYVYTQLASNYFYRIFKKSAFCTIIKSLWFFSYIKIPRIHRTNVRIYWDSQEMTKAISKYVRNEESHQYYFFFIFEAFLFQYSNLQIFASSLKRVKMGKNGHN